MRKRGRESRCIERRNDRKRKVVQIDRKKVDIRRKIDAKKERAILYSNRNTEQER